MSEKSTSHTLVRLQRGNIAPIEIRRYLSFKLFLYSGYIMDIDLSSSVFVIHIEKIGEWEKVLKFNIYKGINKITICGQNLELLTVSILDPDDSIAGNDTSATFYNILDNATEKAGCYNVWESDSNNQKIMTIQHDYHQNALTHISYLLREKLEFLARALIKPDIINQIIDKYQDAYRLPSSEIAPSELLECMEFTSNTELLHDIYNYRLCFTAWIFIDKLIYIHESGDIIDFRNAEYKYSNKKRMEYLSNWKNLFGGENFVNNLDYAIRYENIFPADALFGFTDNDLDIFVYLAIFLPQIERKLSFFEYRFLLDFLYELSNSYCSYEKVSKKDLRSKFNIPFLDHEIRDLPFDILFSDESDYLKICKAIISSPHTTGMDFSELYEFSINNQAEDAPDHNAAPELKKDTKITREVFAGLLPKYKELLPYTMYFTSGYHLNAEYLKITVSEDGHITETSGFAYPLDYLKELSMSPDRLLVIDMEYYDNNGDFIDLINFDISRVNEDIFYDGILNALNSTLTNYKPEK